MKKLLTKDDEWKKIQIQLNTERRKLFDTLSKVINVRRIVILGYCSFYGKNGVSFNELKNVAATTDGNLASHLRRMRECGWISERKTYENRRPKTLYSLTKQGMKYKDKLLLLTNAACSWKEVN